MKKNREYTPLEAKELVEGEYFIFTEAMPIDVRNDKNLPAFTHGELVYFPKNQIVHCINTEQDDKYTTIGVLYQFMVIDDTNKTRYFDIVSLQLPYYLDFAPPYLIAAFDMDII